MKQLFGTLGLILLTLIPDFASANPWVARNGLVVRQTSQTDFEVPWRGLSAPHEFWCAAGDFAMQRLHVPGRTRLYRVSPEHRGAGEAVRFSLSPEGAQPTGIAVIGSPLGLRASHARTLCEVLRD